MNIYDMGLIILLLLLGAFFLVAELVFLPGTILGALLSLASYGAAIYFGFAKCGFGGGIVTIFVVLALLSKSKVRKTLYWLLAILAIF